jgi:NADH dehydrogenase FAD-containing subunit
MSFIGYSMTRVLILGSGFAGLNAAKVFAGVKGVEVIRPISLIKPVNRSMELNLLHFSKDVLYPKTSSKS